MAIDNWHLYVCGLNHKTSSLEDREPLQIGHDDFARAHAEFSEIPGVREGIIVSTCNRDEFYAIMDRQLKPFEVVREFYLKFRNVDITGIKKHFYTKRNKDAVEHLFKVTAGIDSMIIGENQIMGQVKDSYSSACRVKATAKILHRLFHQAFRVGKQVRTDTEMGKGACSVSGASMELLKSKIGHLKIPKVLFIGINRMIRLAVKNLTRIDGISFIFANRTLEKANIFAKKFRGKSASLDDTPILLSQVDIIVSCTGSEKSIITRSTLDKFISENKDHKLFIIDMAIPRDIDYPKGISANIDLSDLKDVEEYVKSQQAIRVSAIPEAEEIIESKLNEFNYWFEHIRREPVYNGLERYFEDLRMEELSGIIDNLDDDMKSKLDQASKRLVERLLQTKIRTANNKPEMNS